MITAANIYIQYGERILLDRVNLVVGERDKLGLVGRNGAGKSTLLKVIAGHIRPDEGNVSRPSESSLGFLHQEMQLPKGKTVLDEALTAFDEAKRLEARIAELNQELHERTDYESDAYAKLLVEMADASDRFELLGGVSMQAEAEKVLKGLGFKQKDLNRLTDEFSGGWQMRVELAKMLLQKPNYLLLDEPTNHLDIESIIWLENFLKDYPGAVIIISHDKQFLDNITNRTVEVELGKLYDYKAAYSKYVALRAERREKMSAAYENQQRVISQKERTINRFMAKATKTKMAQSMQKQLDKIERVEIPDEDTATMNLRFPPAPRSGLVVLDAKRVSKQYGNLHVLDHVDLKIDRGDRVAFVGQNGQGKTTLAKIIVHELSLSGGELNFGHNVSIGYYAQNQAEKLQSSATLLETMEQSSPPEMRTRLRAILGAFLFSGEDVDKKVTVLSGGERARLALACLLLKPFNLLVLDEPTNHLDMLSKDVLKQALMDYDGTLIVVSHDREFLSGLTNRTIEFRDRQLHDHIGDVNAFLEKRQLDDMRSVELSSKNGSAASPTAAKVVISFEERKRLTRNVSNAEKKVEKLEEELKNLETEMAAPTFFEQPNSQQRLQIYQQKKEELETAMMEWETAQEALEDAG
ncbi:MAG TPA: ABC-F family ATP-binding cassette domain-containing protein [Saprospiraceae bacterium]|nr:ABC-F family ATP-binding cassette domain-containing protein [Saprospiraceae bacterium]HMQ83919.1 ABC-F family ATP-binding cassette domain-containing protein [Saprospiraceae bacterium]